MARVLKDYTTRKNELVDTAWALFARHGYHATSVNAIIDSLGVSKGTFYHYFSSKEEILDAVIENMMLRALVQIQPILENKALTALDGLNRFLTAARTWRLSNLDVIREVMRVIYRDENIIIRHKMNRRALALVAPLLADIIARGAAEGVFDTEDPEETARLFLHLANIYIENIAQTFLELDEHPENLQVCSTGRNFLRRPWREYSGPPQAPWKRRMNSFSKTSSKNATPDAIDPGDPEGQ